jgi:hypothetical protein
VLVLSVVNKLFMLSVSMLSVVMLNVVMMSVGASVIVTDNDKNTRLI